MAKVKEKYGNSKISEEKLEKVKMQKWNGLTPNQRKMYLEKYRLEKRK